MLTKPLPRVERLSKGDKTIPLRGGGGGRKEKMNFHHQFRGHRDVL